MSFHAAKLLNDEAIYESNFTVEFKVYVDGVLTAPSSATLSMWTPGNTNKVDEASMSINATTKISSYEISSSLIESLDTSFRLQFTYVISGISYKVNRLFDCVRFRIQCGVIDDDLKKMYPRIASQIWASQATYTTQIEDAFEEIKHDIKCKGNRPHMMIDGSQIDRLIRYKALENIFADFIKETGDKWDMRRGDMAEKYNHLLRNINIRYDFDEDRVIDANQRYGQIHLVR